MYFVNMGSIKTQKSDKNVEKDMLEFLYQTCKEKYNLDDEYEVRALWDVLRLDLTSVFNNRIGVLNGK